MIEPQFGILCHHLRGGKMVACQFPGSSTAGLTYGTPPGWGRTPSNSPQSGRRDYGAVEKTWLGLFRSNLSGSSGAMSRIVKVMLDTNDNLCAGHSPFTASTL